MTKLAGRKIIPRTQGFLQMHIYAYKTAFHDEARKEASVAIVQALDHVYRSEAFLLKPRKPDEHDFYMQFVKLRRMELLANYGDYLDRSLRAARAHLKKGAAAEDANSDLKEASLALGPPKTWQPIAADLTADLKDMRRHASVASTVLGLDLLHMEWLINEWATRKNLFHNQIRDHITKLSLTASCIDNMSRHQRAGSSVAKSGNCVKVRESASKSSGSIFRSDRRGEFRLLDYEREGERSD
jgi:hypothetical protein